MFVDVTPDTTPHTYLERRYVCGVVGWGVGCRDVVVHADHDATAP